MIFLLALFFILGSAVGSFLNVVIDRTTVGKPIFGRNYWRSYCDHCRATLSTLDLVPIISFMGLGGRCRWCRRKLSWQYPIVETLTGFLFAYTFYNAVSGVNLEIAPLFLYLFLVSIFIVVAVIDFKFSLIPTSMVFLASLVVLFYNYLYLDSPEFVLSTLTAFGVSAFFVIIIVLSRGRGMGTGDIPLVFLIGLILSWPLSMVGLFLTFLTGAVVSLGLVLIGKKSFGQTIPFGPFLAFGTIAALFWGQAILHWYLSLIHHS